MNKVIDMNAVEKNYGTVPVIQNGSFRISEGESCGLPGVSGAGKTTLIKLIPGLRKAAVFLSITGLILRIMADHIKQMEV